MVDSSVEPERRKLLVVDDDRVVLASFTEGLALAGFAVSRATSGEEAVAICREQPVDLVVMDVRMPGQSGIDAAAEIRSKFGVPSFFVSASDSEKYVKAAVADGGLGYLVKPVTIRQLVTSIRAALARATEIKALTSAQESLQIALQGDRNIGIATGLIMERNRVTAAVAFDTLRSCARAEQRKLGDVAAEIVAAAERLNLSSRVPGSRRSSDKG
jgi:response regulator NasT